MAESVKQTGSWTDAFPAPNTTAPLISREEVLPDLSSPELLIVDVRRTDYEGGTIKRSINLPAHSFYMNRAILYDLCSRAGVKRVVFYCGKPEPVTTLCTWWCYNGVRHQHISDLQTLTCDRLVKWSRATLFRLVCRLPRGKGR